MGYLGAIEPLGAVSSSDSAHAVRLGVEYVNPGDIAGIEAVCDPKVRKHFGRFGPSIWTDTQRRVFT